jgi:sigma-B regulation protein RsbU (phosphoserine phosphatase)
MRPLNPVDGVRGALLRTLPGRAIVVGVAIKIVVALLNAAMGGVPAFLGVIETVASVAAVAGLVYFGFQLAVLAKRRLLWRVRRKLLVSYLFVGVLPAILLAAFALLCGFLLFYNLSSYLVQSRLRALTETAAYFAETTALEIQRAGARDASAILGRRQASEAAQYPGISVALVPVSRVCAESKGTVPVSDFRAATAGPWAHLEPPRTIPAWVKCSGYSGVLAYSHARAAGGADNDTHMVIRAVAFPDAERIPYAVVVDVLVNDPIRDQLRRETGVEIKSITPPVREQPEALPMVGRGGGDTGEPPSTFTPGILANLPSLVEFSDWSKGTSDTLTVSTALSVTDLYDRISGAEGRVGRTFRQELLIVLFIIAALFLIIQFIALVAGLALAKSITGSVHALFAGTERVRQGDFTHKIAVNSDDQLGELAGSFNQMTASIEDLLLQAAEKKRLEEELRIAHEIQMSLLPQGPLSMPGLTVTSLCVPAREVGGDYYDFLPLDAHRVGVLIADVSGKGTSAALYMAELKGLILSLSEIYTSPRELLITANRIIAQHLDARSFITMTYAVIDMRARTMTYARAGHTPLIYVPGPGAEGRGQAKILVPDGLVLGLNIDNGELFEKLLQEETIPLRPGDLYLFFTDGISEAMNAHDDCFGENRLGQLVETHAHLPCDELRERMLREISAFVGDAPQHDDMTMILLKVDDITEAVA